ncbi:MAG: uncharacterized protein KVP18_004530 [Porospora cf. gigantea A]|uniref:uncharacterized protein n=1 Tax=Porospora cf. gigantea A TaxID=2853593 RepID=UPI00355937B8|nr:MAG: hypothetical protein KVP18_004530 [Porospora cf. gigantea A]
MEVRRQVELDLANVFFVKDGLKFGADFILYRDSADHGFALVHVADSALPARRLALWHRASQVVKKRVGRGD